MQRQGGDRKLVLRVSARDPHLPEIEQLTKQHLIAGNPADHYTEQAFLGKGAYGRVVRAVHKDSKAEVALKYVAPSELSSYRRLMLLREVDMMVKCYRAAPRAEQDCLLRCYGFYDTGDCIVIVLELCQPKDLFADITSRQSYTERDAAVVLAQLAHQLSIIHSAGIVHRDIKPENVLFKGHGSDRHAILADYGLALDMSKRDLFKRVVGTTWYLAPDCLYHRYSPASDIWALGVLLYIMLAGHPPFWGHGPNADRQCHERILRGDFSMSTKVWQPISPDAKDLVRRMLAPDSRQRPTAEQVLEHPFVAHPREAQSPAAIQQLAGALKRLKRLNLRRRFRACAMACVIPRRMTRSVLAKAAGALPEFAANDIERLRAAMASIEIDSMGPLAASDASASSASVDGSLSSGAGSQLPPGALSQAAFEAQLTAHGFGHLPLQALFEAFDVDRSGFVDRDEVSLGLAALRGERGTAATNLFAVLDKNKDGRLSQHELRTAIQLAASGDSVVNAAMSRHLSSLIDRLVVREMRRQAPLSDDDDDEEEQMAAVTGSAPPPAAAAAAAAAAVAAEAARSLPAASAASSVTDASLSGRASDTAGAALVVDEHTPLLSLADLQREVERDSWLVDAFLNPLRAAAGLATLPVDQGGLAEALSPRGSRFGLSDVRDASMDALAPMEDEAEEPAAFAESKEAEEGQGQEGGVAQDCKEEGVTSAPATVGRKRSQPPTAVRGREPARKAAAAEAVAGDSSPVKRLAAGDAKRQDETRCVLM